MNLPADRHLSYTRRLLGTVTARMALGYGLLTIGTLALISMVFYFGTVGVLSRGIDAKLRTVSNHLMAESASGGWEGLRQQIQELLTDGIDTDSEVYLVEAANGTRILGNLYDWPRATTPLNRLVTRVVTRAGHRSVSRLLARRLPDGALLVVGRDLQDIRDIEELVWSALGTGGAFAVQLAIGGAFLFRRQVERRVWVIRQTAKQIEAGDLSKRIPVPEPEDEFSRLSHDINDMLDRIQHLMDGVTHVSDAIAHDLRTPLGRVRGRLDDALRRGRSPAQLADAARSAITSIDELIMVFDKLLRIAEAESGTRRQSFAPVALGPLITDIVELYDAVAETKGITLTADIDAAPTALGDRDLLAGALANLIDNALKYAGDGATVRLTTIGDQDQVSILVRDDGPGIPAGKHQAVLERFYRLDESRHAPGNGLGLSLVAAVASLHRGSLTLEDACPGLLARLVLPRSPEESFQTIS